MAAKLTHLIGGTPGKEENAQRPCQEENYIYEKIRERYYDRREEEGTFFSFFSLSFVSLSRDGACCLR